MVCILAVFFISGCSKTFNKTYGGSGEEWANSVQQTKDGGYILAGWTDSYGAGSYDAWLIKTNANGNKVWEKTFGGSSEDRAYDVQQTSDGGYILAGWTFSFGVVGDDAWLIKTNANGNKVWEKTFAGDYNEWALAVQQTSDGGYILAGSTSDYGFDWEHIWLIKTDANGNKIWDKTYALYRYNRAYAVQQTSDGGYILAGYACSYDDCTSWLIKTDANGNKVWDKTFGGSSSDVQQTTDGGYILAASNGDVWLIKTDADGNKVWDTFFGQSTYQDWPEAVQQTSDGGYILAGVTESFGAGDRDAWLIKTDANGNKVWDKTFGGSGTDWALAVQQTSDGGYILAGLYSIPYNQDAWLIKTDAEGNAPSTPTPG